MPSASPSSGLTRMVSYVTSCFAHTETAPPMVPVRIDGVDTSTLLDTASMVTLAHPQWLTREGNDESGDEEMTVSCVHRDTKRDATVPVRITTPRGECQMCVGAVPNLPVPIFLSRDCPLFQALWRRDRRRRALEVGRRGTRTVACANHALPREVSTRPESYPEEGDDPTLRSKPLFEEDLGSPLWRWRPQTDLPTWESSRASSGWPS